MAKKGWGKFVAFAAVTGAVAAGVSYVLQYKTSVSYTHLKSLSE